jgi:hypothetical protein
MAKLDDTATNAAWTRAGADLMLAKVIEAPGFEGAAVEADLSRAAVADFADSRERHALEVRGDANAGLHSEEKLVVLASMQPLLAGRAREQRRGENVGGHFGGEA